MRVDRATCRRPGAPEISPELLAQKRRLQRRRLIALGQDLVGQLPVPGLQRGELVAWPATSARAMRVSPTTWASWRATRAMKPIWLSRSPNPLELRIPRN